MSGNTKPLELRIHLRCAALHSLLSQSAVPYQAIRLMVEAPEFFETGAEPILRNHQTFSVLCEACKINKVILLVLPSMKALTTAYVASNAFEIKTPGLHGVDLAGTPRSSYFESVMDDIFGKSRGPFKKAG